MYSFISPYLHFTDPAKLCGHPHGRHCASCFAMTFLTPSMVFTGGSISNGGLVWQIWTKALLTGSTDRDHTDLHVDCWMKAVPPAQLTVRENGRPLRNEPAVFPYEKEGFSFSPVIKKLIRLEMDFQMAGEQVSSRDSWSDLFCRFFMSIHSLQKLQGRITAHICIYTGCST